MTPDAVTLLFALLAVGAQLAVVGAVVLSIAARFGPATAGRWASVRRAVAPQAPALALVVATVATAGSLYLSEVANFPPCRLCWYQRYAMYPLVPILAIAVWRRIDRLRPVVVAMALVGGAISIYHMVIERFPTLESTTCDPTNPCSLIWVERFGYLTIPTMALSAFALIATLAVVGRPNRSAVDDPRSEPVAAVDR